MTPIILLCGQAGSGKDTVASFLVKNHNAVTVAQADPMKRFAQMVFDFTEEQLWGPSECRNAPDDRFDDPDMWDGVWEALEDYGWSWVQEVLPDLDEVGHGTALDKLEDWLRSVQDACFGEGKPVTPRYVLQTLGTEWGRMFSPDMWVDYASSIAHDLLTRPSAAYSRTQGLMIVTGAKAPDWVVITDGRFRNEIVSVERQGGITVRITAPTVDTSGVEAAGVKGHISEAELKAIPNHFFSYVFENDKSYGLDECERRVQLFVVQISQRPMVYTMRPYGDDRIKNTVGWTL